MPILLHRPSDTPWCRAGAARRSHDTTAGPGLGASARSTNASSAKKFPRTYSHDPLHPGLVLGTADPGRVGGEPAVLGVVQPPDGEPWVDRIGVGHDRRGVVRDQHPE